MEHVHHYMIILPSQVIDGDARDVVIMMGKIGQRVRQREKIGEMKGQEGDGNIGNNCNKVLRWGGMGE